jgi:hypothetical protein
MSSFDFSQGLLNRDFNAYILFLALYLIRPKIVAKIPQTLNLSTAARLPAISS